MSYTKQTWADGSAGGTPITAARLSYVEDGIAAVAAVADAAVTDAELSAAIAAIPAGVTQTYVDTQVATRMAAGIAGLPAGSTLTVSKAASVWPVRPTSRTDIVVQWKGADPSPAIVASGTGGMIDGVDVRFVTP